MTNQPFDPQIEEAARLAELKEHYHSIMDNRGLDSFTPRHEAIGRAGLRAARAVLDIEPDQEKSQVVDQPQPLGPPPPMPPGPSRPAEQ